jgi:outer membrane protein assembly factor BamB
LPLNRGAAYLDGLLFRGTEDGRVLAYDFKTGKRVWETTIADQKKCETVPAAPIAARVSSSSATRGATKRVGREDWQDYLGILYGAQIR